MSQELHGFFVAPSIIDGEMGEVTFVELDRLSGKWLGTCAQFLDQYDDCFDATCNGRP